MRISRKSRRRWQAIKDALRVDLSEARDWRPSDPTLADDGEPGVFEDVAGLRARLGDFEPPMPL